MHARARGELRVGRRLVRARVRVMFRVRVRVRIRVRVRVGAAGHYLRASIGPSEAVDQLVAAEARFAWHRK